MCGKLSAASQGLLLDLKMRLTATEAAFDNLLHQLELEGNDPPKEGTDVPNVSPPLRAELVVDAKRSESHGAHLASPLSRLGNRRQLR